MADEHETSGSCNNCGSSDADLFLDARCFMTGHPLHAVQCSACGLVYLSPRPRAELGEEYFEKAYGNHPDFAEHPYYRDHEEILRRCRSRFDSLEGLDAPSRRLLDLGAGQGHFIDVATKAGWETEGAEISPAARAAARDLFGISLREDLDRCEGPYGLITLWDVIEHLDDPRGFLAKAMGLLEPGGAIVIETGNVDSREFHSNRERWSLWHVDHNFYYGKKTLLDLLSRLGFLEIRPLPAGAPPGDSPPNRSFLAGALGNARAYYRSHGISPAGLMRALRRRAVASRYAGPDHDFLITVSARRE